MKRWCWVGLLGFGLATGAQAHEEGFQGDLGGMVTRSASPVAGLLAEQQVLPYIYGDWGPVYARVDTLGVRTLALGQGHLELAARIGTEGFDARKSAHPALGERSAPLPIGLGTFQRTPWGGVFAYLMHDTRSGGAFAELNWAGRLEMGAATLYPQLGAQYRSSAYINHLYGLSPSAAAATGLAPYIAGDSLQAMATLHLSYPLSGGWSLQAQARRRWLDKAVTHSPLVDTHAQNSGLLALTRHFH